MNQPEKLVNISKLCSNWIMPGCCHHVLYPSLPTLPRVLEIHVHPDPDGQTVVILELSGYSASLVPEVDAEVLPAATRPVYASPVQISDVLL